MEKRTVFIQFLLVAVLASGLWGCGGQEEAPPAAHTSQTQALVPDSVVQGEEAEPVEVPAEAPMDVVEPQTKAPAEPKNAEPVAPVEAVVVEVPAQAESIPATPIALGDGIFSLQLGSYTVASFAEEKAAQLRDLGYPGTVEEAEVGGQSYHRVFIRGLADRQSAEKLGEDLHTQLGLSYLIRRK